MGPHDGICAQVVSIINVDCEPYNHVDERYNKKCFYVGVQRFSESWTSFDRIFALTNFGMIYVRVN